MDAISKEAKANEIRTVPGFFKNEEYRRLFIDWTSGLCAGFAAATICAPLDLARTRHMLLVNENFVLLKF